MNELSPKTKTKAINLKQTLGQSIFLLISLMIIVCGLYPFILWIIGQSLFPFQANGSIIKNSNNQIIGSKLIAQPFTKDEFFHPRPSACDYNAAASSSSALAASNPQLRDRVSKLVTSLQKYAQGRDIPGDLVTTSASGLDPHITLDNAKFQLGRVVKALNLRLKRDEQTLTDEINQILESKAQAPGFGLFGEKFVNVLEVNLELVNRY